MAEATAVTDRLVEEVRSRLSRARSVFSLAGPGLNPAGKAPAFGDAGALPFFEDPVAVWRLYDEHRARLASVPPNAGYLALAALERRTQRFTLATESIDGLHRSAGARNVVELRGNVWTVRCTRCGLRSANRETPITNPPSCPVCTGLVRPDVVWEAEPLPRELLVRCFDALSRAEVLIVAGTSSLNHPASLFVGVARKAGAYIVEIAAETPVRAPAVDVLLIGAADRLLPLIVPACP